MKSTLERKTRAAVAGAAPCSATRFTFMSDDGKYPVSHDGKVQWLSDREEAIRQAKSWGFSILVEMDDHGHRLGMVNLNELKSPNGAAEGRSPQGGETT